jgi:hypothetical protein
MIGIILAIPECRDKKKPYAEFSFFSSSKNEAALKTKSP